MPGCHCRKQNGRWIICRNRGEMTKEENDRLMGAMFMFIMKFIEMGYPSPDPDKQARVALLYAKAFLRCLDGKGAGDDSTTGDPDAQGAA